MIAQLGPFAGFQQNNNKSVYNKTSEALLLFKTMKTITVKQTHSNVLCR